jgi:hypothetical protein
MKWDIEYTDELGEWWGHLNEAEQESIDMSVRLLEEKGPNLGFPHCSGIESSKHSHMRELEFNTKDDHIECYMRSIRAVARSCDWWR